MNRSNLHRHLCNLPCSVALVSIPKIRWHLARVNQSKLSRSGHDRERGAIATCLPVARGSFGGVGPHASADLSRSGLSALRRDQEFEPLSLGGESHKLDHGDPAWLPGQQAPPHRRPSGSPKPKPISSRRWKLASI